jgi:Ca2+-binding RTX toxin-like protein
MVQTVTIIGDFCFISEDVPIVSGPGSEAKLDFLNKDSLYFYSLTAQGGGSANDAGGDGIVWVHGPHFSEDRTRVQISASANGGVGATQGGDAEIRFFDMDLSTPSLLLSATAMAGSAGVGVTAPGSASITIEDNMFFAPDTGGTFIFLLQIVPTASSSSASILITQNLFIGGAGEDFCYIQFTGDDSVMPTDNSWSENTFNLGAGDDIFQVWADGTTVPEFTTPPTVSPNQFDGGDGFDIFRFDDMDGITVDLFQDGFRNFEQVEGGEHADSITGDEIDNWLYGFGGDDFLSGQGGNDLIEGGEGDDEMDGGVGIDTASFIDSAQAVDVELLLFRSTGNGEDELNNFENVIGSNHDDSILGDSADNRLEGRDGNDEIDGHWGNDDLLGGLGDDRLDGNVGSDWADYSDLEDELSTLGILLDLRIDSIEQDTGLGGVDTLISIENARGSQDDDVITGSEAANWIVGEAGDDLLDGLGGADILEGYGGNDLLFGGGGEDVVSGGLGIDELTGGAGADTFGFYALSLAGDTIMDFAVEDRIYISDLLPEDFTFTMTGNTLTYTGFSILDDTLEIGGSVNFAAPLHGFFVAQEAASGGVELVLIPDAVRNDFNNDGRSDILWRSDTGGFSNWLGLPDGSFENNDDDAFASVSTDWHIAGTGDFNRDGYADVLWRSDTGQLSDWLGTVYGGFVNNDSHALAFAPTDWHVAGTGDFNGDGYDDILWRSDGGQLSNWLGQADGGFANNDANAFTSAPTSWHVAGTGDFNGDHIDDILWRSDAGELSNWLGTETGAFANNDANAFTSVPTDWHVAGTGDFNGDGFDDILWRSDAGGLSNWLGTEGGGFVNNDANAFTFVDTDWQIAAIGDFDGDGFDDIAWRNDDGRFSDWLGSANGAFTNNDPNAFSTVSTDWHTQPVPQLV